MTRTQHAKDRMRQRAISEDIIDVVEELGDPNARCDRLIVRDPELDNSIAQLHRQMKTWKRKAKEKKRHIKAMERLRRQNGATAVVKDGCLITVFFNTERVQA